MNGCQKKSTHIKLFHTHCIQQYSQKFVSILLREIKVLVVFPAHRGEENSKKKSAQTCK